ncbi:hypothetical protein PGB90_000597 [Kerria lacca]
MRHSLGTIILKRTHFEKHSDFNNRIENRRKVFDDEIYIKMKALNYPLVKATDVVKEDFEYRGAKVETKGMRIEPFKLDNTHPYWHDKPCLIYKDNNVLIEGFKQAQVLTNSVVIEEGLPKKYESLYDSVSIDKENELIQMALASALVYDSTQKLLPIKKDLERPAWKFPRDYGITDYRKNYILCNRFLHLCELIAGLKLSQDRYTFEDAYFSVPLLRDEDLLQLQMRADLLLLSKESLPPLCSPDVTVRTELPDMFPMKCTISINEENLYKIENIYPVNRSTIFNKVHTAIIHFNETEVKNVYKTPVLETQTIGRSLMKAFAITAAQARYLYGEDVQVLPEPVVLQCIQTDAKYFHFSVFQLNTLAWPSKTDEIRNIFWSDSIIPAYEFGGYFEGRPTITSYNPEVFKKFLAFYMNY